jgi:hypothetical protein
MFRQLPVGAGRHLLWCRVTSPTVQKPELAIPAVSLLRPKMPELDTIHGIAVLLVLFFHGFGFRYGLEGLSGLPKLVVAATVPGWVGVNLFFVLSGFLITGILLDAKPKANYYRSFYIRRALRILPLYYAVLLLLAVLTRSGWVNRQASWAFLALRNQARTSLQLRLDGVVPFGQSFMALQSKGSNLIACGLETARIVSAVEVGGDLKAGLGLGGAGIVEDLLVGV